MITETTSSIGLESSNTRISGQSKNDAGNISAWCATTRGVGGLSNQYYTSLIGKIKCNFGVFPQNCLFIPVDDLTLSGSVVINNKSVNGVNLTTHYSPKELSISEQTRQYSLHFTLGGMLYYNYIGYLNDDTCYDALS